MELTPIQKRKAKKLLDVQKKGDIAILGHMFEVEEKLDETLEKVDDKIQKMMAEVRENLSPSLMGVLEQVKGKDGQNGRDGKDGETGPAGRDGKDGAPCIITDKDKKEIAKLVTVPVVEKVIEKTEVVREIPTITRITNNVPNPVSGKEIVFKINQLPLTDDMKIDADHIKGIRQIKDTINQVAMRPMGTGNVEVFKNGSKVGSGQALNFTGSGVTVTNRDGHVTNVDISSSGGGGGHTIQDEGTPFTQRTNLNFVGSGVTVTDDAGNDATVVTIDGGGSGTVEVMLPTPLLGDGIETEFTFDYEPAFVFVDRLAYFETDDYTLAGTTITFINGFVPSNGAVIKGIRGGSVTPPASESIDDETDAAILDETGEEIYQEQS